MIILPAIDLINSKVVRLLRGDYSKVTEYALDPIEVAVGFKKDGAEHIHLVDLDGAKIGQPKNMEIIGEIIKASKLNAEIGGGIRTAKTVETYINLGAKRVILGTSALQDKELLKNLVKDFGSAISVGVDVLNGFVAVKGWTEISNVTIDEFMKELCDLGVDNVICTDITKDGAMVGTNLVLYKELAKNYSLKITASGGVSSLDDVKELKKSNVYGAIIGKALYNGGLQLKDALNEVK